jgi:hypothetical protein
MLYAKHLALFYMCFDVRQVTLFSITAIVLTVILGVLYFGRQAAFSIYRLFHGQYKSVGDDQKIDYSNVYHIRAYVPSVSIPTLAYPLLATVSV